MEDREGGMEMTPEDTMAFSDLAETWVENKKRRLRIALYSHDTVGIGHMRRNLLIAQVLARNANKGSEPLILLITGGREVCAFGLPAGTDCLTLPALAKEENGQYHARRWDMSLGELLRLRSRSIAASLRGFAPDVLIVDKVPRGAEGELEPVIEELHGEGRTRLVLGLRDVLDTADTVRREWKETGAEEAIRLFYDAVWVYGDRRVFDPVAEYQWSAKVAAKVSFTGYLTRPESESVAALSDDDLFPALREDHATAPPNSKRSIRTNIPQDNLILCLVGGGQDGSQLAESFAQVDFPSRSTGVILTGPFMPPPLQTRLHRLAERNRRLRVLGFVTDSELLLRRASCVVAMGGYNTMCEILASKKPALIVPRVKPRQEQLIRAERMQALGLVEMLHPQDLSPRALTNWLVKSIDQSPIRAGSRWPEDGHYPIDMDGVYRLPRLLQKLVDSNSSASDRARERSNPYVCF
jgi:predicted glycosyltransferase